MPAPLIPVSDALAEVLSLVSPLPAEEVPLRGAAGRALAADVISMRTQPPFDASAMDGYALKSVEIERDALFKVVGEAAAGHGWAGEVKAGQAVRIFTGAPVPKGADAVVIQENVSRKGDLITLTDPAPGTHIRPAGGDFEAGQTLVAPRILTPSEIALIASMNVPQVSVRRKPVVAVISTGDELVMPGETPRPDQIIASNALGLAAQIDAWGGAARILPIARDTNSSLAQVFDLAAGADLIVTIGGASVGDHDLVADVAAVKGLERKFYKVAMRPGKPLMAGRMGDAAMLGLPGNPVSALVCGEVFLRPMICRMLGLPHEKPLRQMPLSAPLGANGPRAHYMRAVMEGLSVRAFGRQDSSLLTVLAEANALILRPPHDPARASGDIVDVLPLDL